jgi:hypothetical protein
MPAVVAELAPGGAAGAIALTASPPSPLNHESHGIK